MPDTILTETRAFITFVVMSGIAAVVNIAACWVLAFAFPYGMAVTLSYLCGMATAFALVRCFVFRPTGGGVRSQFVRFALVNAISFTQVLVISLLLARIVFPAIGFAYQADTLAHVIGVGSLIATSYLLHKKISFRVGHGNQRGECASVEGGPHPALRRAYRSGSRQTLQGDKA